MALPCKRLPNHLTTDPPERTSSMREFVKFDIRIDRARTGVSE